VFAKRIVADGATVSLALNRMRVAECEIVFQFGQSLAPRHTEWSLQDILQTLESVHPGIEVPDSRFLKFETAGEAQLIADCACSNDMVLGKGLKPDDRLHGLRDLQVKAHMRDGRQFEGVGTNVLGDPLEALRWFVNEITQSGQTIQQGQFVTTGACVVPIPVLPGQTIEADFGWLGSMCVHFS
jgi:2-keto-4-pentenoate hydratase